VIDPGLIYTAFLGGSYDDRGKGTVVDGSGDSSDRLLVGMTERLEALDLARFAPIQPEE